VMSLFTTIIPPLTPYLFFKIPNTGKDMRFKIFRNIGNAFVRLGQFQDAIPSYETIMQGSPDLQTGFNLILCYYAIGDSEKMKRGFSKLLSIPIQVRGSALVLDFPS